VLPGDQIDTDRIIPARYLTRVERSGYGDLLFKDVRGPDFALDHPDAKGASILVVGSNFGCGSSREHAVWAIQQAGFKVVIAKVTPESRGYSDIFRQNSANCGLLLVELNSEHHEVLTDQGTGATATVDLENQSVIVDDHSLGFEIAPASKEAILLGLDLIGSTLRHEKEIAAYEQNTPPFIPRR
jgi:3-isopropylmalate/(R)-2-methylmalate dehydratase small subunit